MRVLVYKLRAMHNAIVWNEADMRSATIMPPKKLKPQGRVRTRYEPPTLSDAISAAQGLSDDVKVQVEIAARLMGLSEDEVRPQVAQSLAQRQQQTVVTGRGGMPQRVIVERKPPRRAISLDGSQPMGRAHRWPSR